MLFSYFFGLTNYIGNKHNFSNINCIQNDSLILFLGFMIII